MPFRSEAQRRYLYANEPEVAKKWSREYGTPEHLPRHKRKIKRGRRRQPR